MGLWGHHSAGTQDKMPQSIPQWQIDYFLISYLKSSQCKKDTLIFFVSLNAGSKPPCSKGVNKDTFIPRAKESRAKKPV